MPLGSITLLLHGRPPCAVFKGPVEEEGEPVLAGVAADMTQVVGALTLPLPDGVDANTRKAVRFILKTALAA